MTALKALIICTNNELTEMLTAVLNEVEQTELTLSGGSDARHKAERDCFDIILSVLPFENSFGLDTAAYISSVSEGEQIVFCPSKVYDEVCSKTVGLDMTILPKNVSRTLAVSVIRKSLAAKRKLESIQRKNAELMRKMDEDRLIYRAKCVLIEYLKITEDEAHRMLQHRAMETHVTLYNAAMDVLKMYEYRVGER